MTAVTRPRGPLPARVYWTRRLLVVAVAFGLVFGVARLLGSGGGGDGPSAQPVGAEAAPTSSAPVSSAPTTPTFTATVPPSVPTRTPAAGKATKATKATKGATPSESPLAAPSGECESSDIVVVPSVAGMPYAARPVVFAMTLTTKVSPACTWTVSARSLVVKVTSGSDRIWSTQQCVSAVPKRSVVLRNNHPTVVPVIWSAQRSDSDCTRSTPWAEPGYYHAIAAAYGADPADLQFELVKAPRRTVTATPTPKPSKKPTASAKPR